MPRGGFRVGAGRKRKNSPLSTETPIRVSGQNKSVLCKCGAVLPERNGSRGRHPQICTACKRDRQRSSKRVTVAVIRTHCDCGAVLPLRIGGRGGRYRYCANCKSERIRSRAKRFRSDPGHFGMALESRSCVVCSGTFSVKPYSRRTCCSRKCGIYFTAAASKARTVFRTCIECGIQFQKMSRGKGLCCSRTCGFQYQRRLGAERRAITIAKRKADRERKQTERLNIRCRVCLRPCGRVLCSTVCARNEYQSTNPVNCKFCGVILQVRRPGLRRCSSIACLEKARAIARRSSHRSRRTTGRRGPKTHIRRAIELGVPWERVNRMAVFERDGWACQICGVDTPQRLLTHHSDPAAPTLDHIVPMTKGGGHLYANCQCLCRRCNSNKGDRLLSRDDPRDVLVAMHGAKAAKAMIELGPGACLNVGTISGYGQIGRAHV